MDGLDPRGQVVVIASTNKLDSLDSAFRRPGRFDRELYFPLPDKQARKKILEIHLSETRNTITQKTIDYIVEKSKGFCGADIRGLCTEAAHIMLKRKFPQLYTTTIGYKVDTERIVLHDMDFIKALETLKPLSSKLEIGNYSRLDDHMAPIIEQTRIRLHSYISKTENLPIIIFSDKNIALVEMLMGNIIFEFESYDVVEVSMIELLNSDSTIEKELVSRIKKFKRAEKSILYLKNFDLFDRNVSDTAKDVLLNFLALCKPEKIYNHIVLISSKNDYTPLQEFTRDLERIELELPTINQKISEESLTSLLIDKYTIYRTNIIHKNEVYSDLQLASSPEKQDKVHKISDEENKIKRMNIRELRMQLRNITIELYREKEYTCFHRPPVSNGVVVYEPENHIDLPMILERLGNEGFDTLEQFKKDIYTMVSQYQEFYSANNDQPKVFKCYALKDTIDYFIDFLDESLINKCQFYEDKRIEIEEINENKIVINNQLQRKRKSPEPEIETSEIESLYKISDEETDLINEIVRKIVDKEKCCHLAHLYSIFTKINKITNFDLDNIRKIFSLEN